MAVAPALKKVTEAIRVVSAFIYTYIIALVVIYQSNAHPFITTAQVIALHARICPNGSQLCMVQIQA